MAMNDPDEFADNIERELRKFSYAGRAAGNKRYLKSDLEHLGASVGEIREVLKRFTAGHPNLSRLDVLSAAQALWSRPVHERRMAAVMLLESRTNLLIAEDLDFLETLIREARGWAFVDAIAGDIAGAILVRHPGASRRVDRWALDPDFWVRRSALLSTLLPHKAGRPLDRFLGYAEAMLDETMFFIRKAIGWVLREAGKQRGDEVFAWLESRMARVSGVTIREAVKYLSPSQRQSLLAVYGSRRPRHRRTGR